MKENSKTLREQVEKVVRGFLSAHMTEDVRDAFLTPALAVVDAYADAKVAEEAVRAAPLSDNPHREAFSWTQIEEALPTLGDRRLLNLIRNYVDAHVADVLKRESEESHRARVPDFNDFSRACYEMSASKGWHERLLGEPALDGGHPTDVNVDGVAAKLALIHSEVSEALEELRKDGKDGKRTMQRYYVTQARPGTKEVYAGTVGAEEELKPEGFVVELADVVIRIGDLCGALGLDLDGAIKAKMAFNATRPHKHGGKNL